MHMHRNREFTISQQTEHTEQQLVSQRPTSPSTQTIHTNHNTDSDCGQWRHSGGADCNADGRLTIGSECGGEPGSLPVDPSELRCPNFGGEDFADLPSPNGGDDTAVAAAALRTRPVSTTARIAFSLLSTGAEPVVGAAPAVTGRRGIAPSVAVAV